MPTNRICPYTQKEIHPSNGQYYSYQAKLQNKTVEQVKYEVTIYNYPKLTKNNVQHLYLIDMYGLPTFLKEFGINYKLMQWLLKYYNIKQRGQKEGTKAGAQKAKKTCLEKYGVDNISKVDSIQTRKEETFLKNYGVNNIFKEEKFKKSLNKRYIKKFGMTFSEKKKVEGKKVWKNQTDEQTIERLKNSIWNNPKCIKDKGVTSSKLELKVKEVLDELDITYTSQYIIGTKSFDIFIKPNILIEINGTAYHADPKKYKKTDIVKLKGFEKLALDIWNRDRRKKRLANKHGFKVIYIWERELNTKNKEKLIKLICKKLKLNL